MEDLTFDIGDILTEEEAKKLFEEQATEDAPAQPENDETKEDIPAENDDEGVEHSEEVGEEEKEPEEKAVIQEGDGASPNIYSSIASALKNDGIFPEFEDSDLGKVETPEDFAELFEKAVASRLDERQRRIDEALGNGVEPDTVKMYEQTLQYLGSINAEVLAAEGEDGEKLRRQIIYNDLLNRGYSNDKALKEVEKSFRSGTDVDDAKDALEALNKYYSKGYENAREQAKARVDAEKEAQKKQAEAFSKMVLRDEVKLGDTVIDKRTCQRIYDAVTKPVHKDEKTGRLLTAVQKFQQENPTEFLKQLGMWYVLTDAGKNMDGFTKEKVRAEKNKSIRELSSKINTTALNKDGSLRYASAHFSGEDPLLSDGWEVGWKK